MAELTKLTLDRNATYPEQKFSVLLSNSQVFQDT